MPFCNTGCPLGNLIPAWNDLVYRDHWREAMNRLRHQQLPRVPGMLCPAPCEAACVLSINDKPVTIKEIELSIINRAFEEGWVEAQAPPPEIRTGKRVAVVGSGPAGFAAAQQLNWAGHSVVVFEKDDRVGGLLAYGIPDYKIEKWVVDRRVALMEEGRRVPHQFLRRLQPDDRGAQERVRRDHPRRRRLARPRLPVPGRELDGIHLAMDYLVRQNRRVRVYLSRKRRSPRRAGTSLSSAGATRAPTVSGTPTARAAPR